MSNEEDYLITYRGVNRVEVIDDTGRAYVMYGVEGTEVALQDGGRTLKVFVNSKAER